MTLDEFSDTFDTLLNSYDVSGNTTISLDEYEKSVFLTKAQNEIVINLYNGKNVYGESFENTEEIRRWLSPLVQRKIYDEESNYRIDEALLGGYEEDEKDYYWYNYELPENLMYITLEQAEVDNTNTCFRKTIRIQPVSQDEFNIIKYNPFKGPTKYKALRLDCGSAVNDEVEHHLVEIFSKVPLKHYTIWYLEKPTPIVLTDLPYGVSIDGCNTPTECRLNPAFHMAILERAVALAIASKSVANKKDSE